MDSSFKNVDNFGTIDPQKEEDLENEGNLKNDGTLNNEDSLTNERKYRKADYIQRRLCFVNVQSSLHENVVFSVCARMCNATYFIFIILNSISCLDACYHFRLNTSCGVAVTVRSQGL